MFHTAKTVRAWAEQSGQTVLPRAQFLDAFVLSEKELELIKALDYQPKLTREGRRDANTPGYCEGWKSAHLYGPNQFIAHCPDILKPKLTGLMGKLAVRSIDIMRMEPAGFIAPHTDDLGQGEETYHIYVPLDMPEGSGLAMADGVIDMPLFSVNVFNSGRLHAAYNDSNEFRYILTLISKDGTIATSYFPGAPYV